MIVLEQGSIPKPNQFFNSGMGNFPILIFKFLKLRLCIDLKIFIKTYFDC